jgi:hypothetical protein
VITVDARIQGIQPLLMKSCRGVDRTDPIVQRMKAITDKAAKKRTDADWLELDRLEFEVGLYWNGTSVYMPDVNIIGAIRDGARAERKGKDILAGVDVVEAEIPIAYDGPKTIDGLYEARFVDRRRIKNAGSGGAVMRVRPRFNQWAIAFGLVIDEKVVSPKDVKAALEYAGQRKGIGDFRPRFGRFQVVGWKEGRA